MGTGENILCSYLAINNKIIICGSEPESQFRLLQIHRSCLESITQPSLGNTNSIVSNLVLHYGRNTGPHLTVTTSYTFSECLTRSQLDDLV